MERSELEAILDVKLDPIRDTIAKLEKTQEQIVTLLTGQARQDEKINGMEKRMDAQDKKVESCEETHDDAFNRIRALEMDGGRKMWDVLKIIGAALLAGLVGVLVGRMKA